MTPYDKIRAALELLEWRVLEAERNNQPIVATRRQLDEALAALAELERAAKEPAGWQWEHPCSISYGGKQWRFEQHWNRHTATVSRPVYTTPPAPVAEIREPTDDECRNIWREAKANEGDGSKVYAGRAMFDAVRDVMLPKSEGQS